MAKARQASKTEATEGKPPAEAEPTSPPDAVCFTAGLKGGPFGAGVIHAYLAADRPAPKVVAGISLGALSAAAMHRCFSELTGQGATREANRWRWFRRYLGKLSSIGLDVIWKSFPDPVDFFADRPPVKDPSCPPLLRDEEVEARRRFFLLTKLGRWAARLPLRLSTVMRLVVSYVRYKEGYGSFGAARYVVYQWRKAKVLLILLLHLALSPQWTRASHFKPPTDNHAGGEAAKRPRPHRRIAHPLFGYSTWLSSVVLLVASTLFLLGIGAWLSVWGLGTTPRPWMRALLLPFLLLVAAALVAEIFQRWKSRRSPLVPRDGWGSLLVRHLARQIGIEWSLLSDYELHRALLDVFRLPKADTEPRICKKEPHLLIVAAAIETPADRKIDPVLNQQLWAPPGVSLITALRAAIALPGLFAPIRVEEEKDLDLWLPQSNADDQTTPCTSREGGHHLDLIDGATVRRNPLPALFAFLKKSDNQSIARALEGLGPQDKRIHVVYNVPIEPEPKEERTKSESLDIVDVAALSLELADRRDTKLECRQTNFLSKLEHKIQAPGGPPDADAMLRIFADEIAPRTELSFHNSLAPSREELLKACAEGCRRTLERLYSANLEAMPAAHKEGIACSHLLRTVASKRVPFLRADAPGLPEVCRSCTRLLQYSPKESASDSDYSPSFGLVDEKKVEKQDSSRESLRDPRLDEKSKEVFDHLGGEEPVIAFVASGGVFRGATHIGVLAALRTLRIRPDLIVGASVGALIGGALGAISVLPDDEALQLLEELAETFLKVDEKVALTRTLKNAVKQLGVRGQMVKLSSRDLRRLILAGTRADPGYAAAGAPPALIDALATAFLLPYRRTISIASSFVAGHYTRAIRLFWKSVQADTLRRLDIREAAMGISLLQPLARQLLRLDELLSENCSPDGNQPFHSNGKKVSFFCTTTALDTHSARVLGRDFPKGARELDFANAVLASGAFPGIFPPRPESSVFPGLGHTNVLFSDGGMFDNLPFMPTLEILAEMQQAHGAKKDNEKSYRFLEQRWREPNLFIAGGLDASLSPDAPPAKDLVGLFKRSGRLKNNLKIETAGQVADLTDGLVARLLEAGKSSLAKWDSGFANGIVSAGVLKILPTDQKHLNGTFAFSPSTGLKPDCVQKAIADGCFQTFRSLTETPTSPVTKRSVAALRARGRIPPLTWQTTEKAPADGHCPFFLDNNQPFVCPFRRRRKIEGKEKEPSADLQGIYAACITDDAHLKIWKAAQPEPSAPAPSRWASWRKLLPRTRRASSRAGRAPR